MVLEEVKRVHEMMYTKSPAVLLAMLMAELCTIILHFNFFFQIENGEYLGKLNDEGRGEIIQEDKG